MWAKRQCPARLTAVSTDADTPEHWHWRDGTISPGPIVIFDIDGVISDASQRQHFLDSEPQDWKGFFAACEDDAVLAENAKILELVDERFDIVLLTARPMWVQDRTLAWLATHDFRWDLLIMRDHKNPKASAPFKVENAQMLIDQGHDLHVAFEDDRRNVEAYRRAGINCVYIHSGYYD